MQKTLMMVTYNRLDFTKLTLQSINDTIKGDFNLVIVDNNSKDDTLNFLKSYNHTRGIYKLALNKENLGIGVGRNQTMKMAVDINSDWFVTIDNDVILPNNWLDECVDILSSNTQFGMIGVNFEGKDYTTVTVNNRTFQWKQRGTLGTACIVFPKRIQKTFGYFNTEYGLYGEEDADYGCRLGAMGFKMGYISTPGTHLGEDDTAEYKAFKKTWHDNNYKKFSENVMKYYNREKPLFVKYDGRQIDYIQI